MRSFYLFFLFMVLSGCFFESEVKLSQTGSGSSDIHHVELESIIPEGKKRYFRPFDLNDAPAILELGYDSTGILVATLQTDQVFTFHRFEIQGIFRLPSMGEDFGIAFDERSEKNNYVGFSLNTSDSRLPLTYLTIFRPASDSDEFVGSLAQLRAALQRSIERGGKVFVELDAETGAQYKRNLMLRQDAAVADAIEQASQSSEPSANVATSEESAEPRIQRSIDLSENNSFWAQFPSGLVSQLFSTSRERKEYFNIFQGIIDLDTIQPGQNIPDNMLRRLEHVMYCPKKINTTVTCYSRVITAQCRSSWVPAMKGRFTIENATTLKFRQSQGLCTHPVLNSNCSFYSCDNRLPRKTWTFYDNAWDVPS